MVKGRIFWMSIIPGVDGAVYRDGFVVDVALNGWLGRAVSVAQNAGIQRGIRRKG